MNATTQNDMRRLRDQRDKAVIERDYLVEQYEKAVGCGPKGFIHAACHIYNAIVNAKCDVNAERFTQIIAELDTARRDYEVMNIFREAAEQDLEAALEREQALLSGKYVLVPIEPTNEMMQAGFDMDEEGMDAVAIYKAMLAVFTQSGEEK